MDSAFFKKKLIALRKETEAAIKNAQEAAKPVELDQTMVGRISRMDAMQQQEMTLAGQRRREALVQKIDAALKRIENDNFGFCVKCEEEIAPKRLGLDPTTLTCIACAEK